MKTSTVPKSKCPSCDSELDRTTGINHEHEPSPGDLTICIRCGELLQFGETCLLELIPENELELVKKDRKTYQLLIKAQRRIRALP